MAGLEPDISSYNQPLPVSPLKTVSDLQSLQSNAINIDKQKLDLMNTQFGLMNQELSTMIDDPTITKEQAAKRLTTFATTLKLPPEAVKHMMNELAAAPSVKAFSENALRRGMDTQQRINQQYGAVADKSDSQFNYQGVQQPASKGGGFIPATKSAIQVPPTTPIQDPSGRPGLVGPAAAPGFAPASGLPVEAPAARAAPVPSPRPRPALPVERTGPAGPTVSNGSEFNNRFSAAFPNAIATGPAPGVAGANQAVAEQSGKDYAVDLNRAKNFQADIYPAVRVLDILKAEGPQAFGVGTDNLNTLKNAIVTWFPNVDPKTIQSVANFEEAKKQLVALARSAGNTGTNDQLAAAFEANPNTKMTGATVENVLKSVIALRKMQHAQTLLFGQQGLQPSEYSQWISKNQNVLDPRAFGFDIMSNDAKTKLLETMATKDRNGNWIAKKGKEREFNRFENSLSFANDAGLIEPPGRK